MANIFRQFLVDVENGDINAVKRNIENGIDLETRDEVRHTHNECGRINGPFSILMTSPSFLIRLN